MSIDQSLEYFAYCDIRSIDNPIWRLTNTGCSIYKEKPKHLKFISVPTPMSYVGQTVYIPNKLWYKSDTIKELEPVFKDNKFYKFKYHVGKEHLLTMSEDFFTTKSEAIKRAWINKIKSLLF